MTPGRYDFQVFRGTTFERDIRIENSAAEIMPYPGFTPRLSLRRVPLGEVEITGNTSWMEDDPTTGTIQMDLNVSQTTLLTYEKYVYDLEIEHTDGTVLRVLNGIFKVAN
jgi:hypothetical protein